TVTIAAMNPPIPPSRIQGPTTEGSNAVRTWLQAQAAGTTTRKRSNAALLTVPSSVMDGAVGSRRRSAKVRAFKAGLAVRISAMGLLERMYFDQSNLVQRHPLRLRIKSCSTRNFS